MRRVQDERATHWHRQMRESVAAGSSAGSLRSEAIARPWAAVVDCLAADGGELDTEARYTLIRLTLDAQLPVAEATWWRLLVPHLEPRGVVGLGARAGSTGEAPSREEGGITLDGYALDPQAVRWLMHSAWPQHFYDNVERWWQHPTMPASWRLLAIERHWVQRRKSGDTLPAASRDMGEIVWGGVQDEVRSILDAMAMPPVAVPRDDFEAAADGPLAVDPAAGPPWGARGEDWGNPPVWALVQLMRDQTRDSPDAMWRWAVGLRQILQSSFWVSSGHQPIMTPLWASYLAPETWAMAVRVLTTAEPLTRAAIQQAGGHAPAAGDRGSASEKQDLDTDAVRGFDPDSVCLTKGLPTALATYSAEQWARVLPSLDRCRRTARPRQEQDGVGSTPGLADDWSVLRAALRPVLLSPWPGLRLWAVQQVGFCDRVVGAAPAIARRVSPRPG